MQLSSIMCFLLVTVGFQSQVGYSGTVASSTSCTCEDLICTCCLSSMEPIIANTNTACVKAAYVPNDLRLNVNIEVNGRNVYGTKIDPGNFPVCTPGFPAVCLALNRVHFGNEGAQFCTDVRLGHQLSLFKIPCLSYVEGNLIASPNAF